MTKLTISSFETLSKNDLSANQGWCLSILLRGDQNLTVLAGTMGISTAAMTGLVDHLTAKGFARRIDHETDRRVKLVSLSPRGRSFAKSL